MTNSTTLLIGAAFIVWLLIPICGCSSGDTFEDAKNDELRQKFIDYWQTGEGELSSYRIEQAKDGAFRGGEAIMAFAVEDFSRKHLTKLEKPDEAGSDRLSVLRFNFIKRFSAGACDFSMMQSTFTPTAPQRSGGTIKSIASSQDWSGQSFLQLALNKDGAFSLELRSYMQVEGDKQTEISADLLEDEIWNRIRINPATLPEGEMDLVPGSLFSLYQQQPIRPRKARLRLEQDGAVAVYTIEYLHLDRTLTISFEPQFPHRILSWTEVDGGELSSRATLQRTIKDAYWLHGQSQYDYLRDSLLAQ